MLDLIIIGGGPSGITAGIYSARKKLQSLLITRDFFGQIAKTFQVDNWPGEMGISGMALAKKFENHLKEFEIEIKEWEEVVQLEKKDGGFLVKTKSNKIFEGKVIIIATGKKPKRLDISGEKELEGKGVSFCSICDAPFFKGKEVAVVGGGNAGAETALDLAKYAEKVFLFEASDRFLADELLIEQAEKTGKTKFYLSTSLEKIIGDKKVEAIVCKNKQTGKLFQMPIDGVFVQIGSVPDTDFAKRLVELNEKGEIKINPSTCETSISGVFAAGDATDIKYKQVVVATGEGAKAALSAYEYLRAKYF